MTKKINIFSILIAASFFLFVACEKENIYEAIDNREVQKVDPFIALDKMMDTPIVMGKAVLDNNDEFQSGWIIDKAAKLHQFQLAEAASFPTRFTAKSELLVETILKNTTELAEVDAMNLMREARILDEFGHIPAVYRSGEEEASTDVYFYFADVSNTTCEASNGAAISYVTSTGCEADASTLRNCTTENSITTMMIHAEGGVSVTLPENLGQPLVSYMNRMIREHDESN